VARLIKIATAGKDRILLEKGIALAIRELTGQDTMDEKTHDLLAYISLSLLSIDETIDASVTAWEKRGYWIKADHYRMEWTWAGRLGEELKQAILHENWADVTRVIGAVTQKLSKVKMPQRSRMGTPWIGAYRLLNGNGQNR
jgi:hypothetical protein